MSSFLTSISWKVPSCVIMNTGRLTIIIFLEDQPWVKIIPLVFAEKYKHVVNIIFVFVQWINLGTIAIYKKSDLFNLNMIAKKFKTSKYEAPCNYHNIITITAFIKYVFHSFSGKGLISLNVNWISIKNCSTCINASCPSYNVYLSFVNNVVILKITHMVTRHIYLLLTDKQISHLQNIR